ncbi:hypothetical protein P7C73_g5131, partial [Tremellales sp. Uapishka_1]
MTSRTSIRLLHTSRAHFNAPSPITSQRDLLTERISSLASRAASSPSSYSSSSSSSSSAPALTSRMLRDLPDRTEEDETRKRFSAGQRTSPHSFRRASLYPEQKRRAVAPLLGPPVKIAKQIDPFHLSRSSPLEHVMNPNFVYSFLGPMGKIKSRAKTGLTWKSQRMVGKMVRRARGMGLISRWSNEVVEGGVGAEEDAYLGRMRR